MNCELGIVKTVNLDNEQLLVIESSRGDCVCVIHRGVCLIGCGPARSGVGPGGSGLRTWREWLTWLRGVLIRQRAPAATAHREGIRPVRWIPA